MPSHHAICIGFNRLYKACEGSNFLKNGSCQPLRQCYKRNEFMQIFGVLVEGDTGCFQATDDPTYKEEGL